nr:MAG TPA: hypothetical protein [Caudoviricetes sp.]
MLLKNERWIFVFFVECNILTEEVGFWLIEEK